MVSPVAVRNVTAYSCVPVAGPVPGVGGPGVGAVSGAGTGPMSIAASGPARDSPLAVMKVTAYECAPDSMPAPVASVRIGRPVGAAPGPTMPPPVLADTSV